MNVKVFRKLSISLAVLAISVGAAMVSTAASAASDGTQWSLYSGHGSLYSSVVYGGPTGQELFVAVGGFNNTNTNSIMTSRDGMTWTAVPGVTGEIYDVVYGGPEGQKKFVTISSFASNGVWSSVDGLTWTELTKSISATDIAYGGPAGQEVFVAVSPGFIFSSPDGVTWTKQNYDTTFAGIPYGIGTNFYDVFYANGLFVATAGGALYGGIYTSPDGITWTPRSNLGKGYVGTFGNGRFVVLGTDGSIKTSEDGVTWTFSMLPGATNRTWDSVTFGNGIFVAVSKTGTGDRVMTSPDGITWTLQKSAADKEWLSVTYGDGRFVAVGRSRTQGDVEVVMTSGGAVSSSTTVTSTTSNQVYATVDGNKVDVSVANVDDQTVITGTDFSLTIDSPIDTTDNVIKIPKGDITKYSGKGLKPQSKVTANLLPADTRISSETTRKSGAFSGELSPSEKTKSGTQQLRVNATGKNSQKIAVFAAVQITKSKALAADTLPATGTNASTMFVVGASLIVIGGVVVLRRRVIS